jgi:hypothetical protein
MRVLSSPHAERSPVTPFGWPREHQLALLIGTALGASFGVLIGYIFFSMGYAFTVGTFGRWLDAPIRNSVLEWGLFGGVAGASVMGVAIDATLSECALHTGEDSNV